MYRTSNVIVPDTIVTAQSHYEVSVGTSYEVAIECSTHPVTFGDVLVMGTKEITSLFREMREALEKRERPSWLFQK